MKKYTVFSKKSCFSFCIFTAVDIYFSVIVYKQVFRKVSQMKKIIVILLAGMLSAGVFAADNAPKGKAAPAAAQNVKPTEYDRVVAERAKQQAKEEAEKKERMYSNICCYLPNRLLDLLDIVSIDLKSGIYFGAGFQITKAFGLGGQIGYNAGLYKDINRQYGIVFESGYQAQVGFLTTEDVCLFNPIGNVQTYWEHGNNFPDPKDKLYDRYTGARDYWAVEVYLYALVGAKVSFHPIEFADFFAGFICNDELKKDDLKLKIY